MNKNYTSFIFSLLFLFSLSFTHSQSSNCSPIPEVNFPGGRVVLSFDGNVHDDDDIIAMGYAAGLWWAAGLQDQVVQIEYNNHVCNIDVQETDGSGVGEGDDSQNMRTTASGIISQFGYDSDILYDYERRGSSSTNKMALEIEKSTSANPLWIIAGGPMETVWRALEKATGGFNNVTIVSHSTWNQNHTHCSDAHDWNDLKSKYQSRGVFFIENCEGACSGPGDLNDQNAKLSNHPNNWYWMRDSNKAHNRWIYSRNPFSTKFDPSDAGMSYYLISGGPYNGGNKTPDSDDFRKLMENPCDQNPAPVIENPTTVAITSPNNNQKFVQGDDVVVELTTSGSTNLIKHQIFLNGNSADVDGKIYNGYTKTNISAGEYEIRAEVTNENGEVVKSSVNITVAPKEEETTEEPAPPTPVENNNISIAVAPSAGEKFIEGENVSISLTGNSASGSIVKYRIFVDGKLVDTDGSNFTPHVLKNVQNGNYSIKGEVTDSAGNMITETVQISVVQSSQEIEEEEKSEAPSEPVESPKPESKPFSILSPNEGESFAVGETITIDLLEGDNIEKYQIFVNNDLVDTDGAYFTPHEISNAEQGTYAIRAEATDNTGLKTSETVTVIVGDSPISPKDNDKGMEVVITPANGAEFSIGDNVAVSVEAKNTNTDIVKYRIFVNGNLVDTDGSYFTPYVIQNINGGSHTLKAEVTNDQGEVVSKTIKISASSFNVAKSTGVVLLENKGVSNAISLRVAPNPVQNGVMNVFQKKSQDLIIRNFSGRVIKTLDQVGKEAQVDVSTLAPGVYILESDSEYFRFVIK